ncbi:MAG: sigma-70 family RNA polymerase sigma factor, partial [Candidatus Poribacteria bacterium]|nr:sigma-70 family RNA polymerase sigma factor [Candidatus Poribacteria bacterium]
MKNADVELIQRVLDGDDTAFSDLVKKYQKSVHALAWRKVQDFHIAEDITQETFLKAYKKLSTLQEPQSFASWLYVIAANHCHTWLSKKRLPTQSLESTSNTELEKANYSSYVSAENERASVEAQREVVKKLLAKLQESDRTVITLYYLGGMTYEEISRFLGVSVSSIKNRLYRARQHLKKEEPMIREALENYQIIPHLTEKIMQEIDRLKPAAPSGSKPLVPWAIAASSAVLIVFMLGIGSQYLARFQQPYSLDAQVEMTVELVDISIVQNFEVKPDVRNQPGKFSDTDGRDNDNGEKANQILSAERDYTRWNLPEGAKARIGKGRADDIAYSPDGTRLAVASYVGIWIYDAHNGQELDLLTGHTARILSVAFSPDGKTLASGSKDNTIRLWDARTGTYLRTMTGWTDSTTGVVFSPDGKALASGSTDNTIRLWNPQTDTVQKTLVGHTDKILSVVFSQDGKTLASAGKDNTIRVWDTQSGEIRKTFVLEHSQEIYKMAFSADAKTLASWSFESPIYLWNAQTGELRHTFPLQQMDFVNEFAFSPDGKTLASAMNDGIIHLWNVQTGEYLRSLIGHTHWALNVAFSPDGKTLASGSFDSTIRFWDVQTGKPQKTLTGHLSDTVYVTFSSDGKTLANAMEDDTIRLWDSQTGELRQILKRQNMSSIAGVAFSPDNKTLAGGDDSFAIRLWDVQTGTVRKTFGEHKDYVTSVVFSAGGTLLA